MTLKQALDQAYDSMSLAWGDMADNLVKVACIWSLDNNLELNPWQEVLGYLRGKA